MSKPSDLQNRKQTTKPAEITYAKAGPNSRSGGKNRGQNGESRTPPLSLLEQRRNDAIKRRDDERKAAIAAFQDRQVQLATTMVEELTEWNGKPVGNETRDAATTLIQNFRYAEARKEGDKVIASRTAVAEEYATLEIPEDILLDTRRFNAIKLGFVIARTLLPKAYDAAKAEQTAAQSRQQ